MKHKGKSKFPYEEERNNELMEAYIRECASRKEIRTDELFPCVVASSPSRFWVSEERAAIVIGEMMRGGQLKRMRPLKRTMYYEIYNRVKRLQARRPDWPLSRLVAEVVCQPAPHFYLTPGSAKVIISRIKNKLRIKQRLLHQRKATIINDIRNERDRRDTEDQ